MLNKRLLEGLYCRYNRRQYVHPDPLEFLYRYPHVRDREIAGLLAACLAYGRVEQILRSVGRILDAVGRSPREFVMRKDPADIRFRLKGFKHRFTTADDIVSLMQGIRRLIRKYGSLNECFIAGMRPADATVLPALTGFVRSLSPQGSFLVPSPPAGSACKRLNLYLRWMVRCDAVDPGGWRGIRRDQLIVPLDTHMVRIGRAWRLTRRKSSGMRMALDITDSFRKVDPEDPVKYDFALTRFGIRRDMDIADLLNLHRDFISAAADSAT